MSISVTATCDLSLEVSKSLSSCDMSNCMEQNFYLCHETSTASVKTLVPCFLLCHSYLTDYSSLTVNVFATTLTLVKFVKPWFHVPSEMK